LFQRSAPFLPRVVKLFRLHWKSWNLQVS